MTDVQATLDQIGAEGDDLAEAGRFTEAVATYRRGLDLIARDPDARGAALWFHVAIGDAHWLGGEPDDAGQAFVRALLVGGLGNPFVHLRLGQAHIAVGREREGLGELLKALLIQGVGIFEGEDPRYLALVTSAARPPADRDSWDGFEGLPGDHPALQHLLNPAQYRLRHRPS